MQNPEEARFLADQRNSPENNSRNTTLFLYYYLHPHENPCPTFFVTFVLAFKVQPNQITTISSFAIRYYLSPCSTTDDSLYDYTSIYFLLKFQPPLLLFPPPNIDVLPTNCPKHNPCLIWQKRYGQRRPIPQIPLITSRA